MKLIPDDMPTDYQGVSQRLTEALLRSGLISDTTVGSVAQILTETFAREMAVFYAILEKAHLAGYLNTAAGKALDQVVAVLGVRRAKPGLLHGYVLFSRGTPAPQDIVIPAGTKLTGAPLPDGTAVPIMETVEQTHIPRGQQSVSVAVQELSDSELSSMLSLPADAINLMPRPLLGVERISNPDPITRTGQEESDESLRTRAGAVLREGQKGTVEAIEAAVRNLGIQTVKVVEAPEGRIGCIEVRVGDPQMEKQPKRQHYVEEAVREAKAAGIRLDLKFLQSVYFRPQLTVEPEGDMDDQAFIELAKRLKQSFADFIANLPPETALTRKKLDAALMSVPGIHEITVKMQTFILKYPQDSQPVPREDTGLRELPNGDWYIGPLENAAYDPLRWPMEVVRKRSLTARLDLAVTVPDTGMTMDAVRRNVRAAADDYLQRLLPDQENKKRRIVFKDLLQNLREKARIRDLQRVTIIHLADGLVEDLASGKDAFLSEGERISIDRIDIQVTE